MATMDEDKSMKLQQYAVALTQQAEGEERSGKSEEAIKHYLKLVDVFLVLAAEAQDHNTWLQYIRQAEAYQTRTRTLIPSGQTPSSRNPTDNRQHAQGSNRRSEERKHPEQTQSFEENIEAVSKER